MTQFITKINLLSTHTFSVDDFACSSLEKKKKNHHTSHHQIVGYLHQFSLSHYLTPRMRKEPRNCFPPPLSFLFLLSSLYHYGITAALKKEDERMGLRKEKDLRTYHLDWKRSEEPSPVHSGLWEDALLYLFEGLNLLSGSGDPLSLQIHLISCMILIL